jgi:hypothetical protein
MTSSHAVEMAGVAGIRAASRVRRQSTNYYFHATILRLTHTRTHWHPQIRIAEAQDGDGAFRYAVLDQFGLHSLGSAHR